MIPRLLCALLSIACPDQSQSVGVQENLDPSRYCIAMLNHDDTYVRVLSDADILTFKTHIEFLLHEEILGHEFKFGCDDA